MKHSRFIKCSLIFLIIVIGVSYVSAAAPSMFFSQLGYKPNEPKYFALKESAANFQLTEAKTGKTVFNGKILGPLEDAATGLQYWRGDFSKFKQPGEYYISVDGKERSGNFSIGEKVWQGAQQLVFRSYYLERCGMAVKDQATGFTHEACHLDDAIVRHDDPFHKEDDVVDVSGGWHDAGDYGKYISSAGISVSVMLMAYELYPQQLASDMTGIPESGNGKPDLLDEVRWKLDWMLKMQRPDGGVYHKVGSQSWPGGILPEDDYVQRYLFGASTSATAKFAATTAFASRIYRKTDPAYADRLLKAAELAWQFLMTAPYQPDPGDSDNSGSGPYGDRSVKDDHFWAAVELYLSTNNPDYQDYVIFNIPSAVKDPSWEDGSALAMYHYAVAKKDKNAKLMRKMFEEQAELLVQKAAKSVFGLATAKEEFEWSSNRKVMADSIVLILADRIKSSREYQKVAYMQLHYIFGFNPLAKSFVTGLGINPVTQPHQRLFWATGILVPGELAGGPNNAGQSGVEPKNLGALSYADESPSYSSNEYAIDVNANLLFVLVSANK